MTCLDKDSSSVPKMDNRRLDVDALKALGALLVVAYHCGVVSLVGAAADSYPLLYLRSFFAICVPAFFLATGLLYSGRDFPVGKGLRKAAKLFALTLIWGGVTWIIVAGEKGLAVSPGTWISGVLTLQQGVVNHLWFLPALAIVCLLLPFFSSLQRHDPRLFSVLVVGCLVFVFGCDALSRLADLAGWVIDSQALGKLAAFVNRFNPLHGIHGHSIAYCLVGMWLSGREERLEERCPRVSSLLPWAGILAGPLLLAAYSAARVRLTGEPYDPTWNGYSFVGTFVAVAGIYLILHRVLSGVGSTLSMGKIISLVGRNSLAVYLFHWPLTGLVRGLLPDPSLWFVRLAVGLLICAALALLCSIAGELLSKTKAGRWLLSA